MKIELLNIHKHFGPVRANDGITFTVEGGTIHGLLGENGAGKSTLMKVLSGYISADSGEIRLDGRPVRFSSPEDAIRHGVGMLHQDPLDFPPMSLLDNFITGRDHSIAQKRGDARVAFLELCSRFDFDLDPETLVSEITVGERQQLEIVRLLWLGVRALILDEPTTGISTPQKVKLFATLKQLAEQGMTIIFVSHKLEDIEALCAKASVLRQGMLTGESDAPFDTGSLIELMFGQIIEFDQRPAVEMGNSLLELDNVTISDFRLEMAGLSLTVQAGEVIGIAGLEGSGQQLLMQACAGLLPLKVGHLRISGRDMTHKPYPTFTAAGVSFMPANRMTEGLVPGLTIAEHLILGQQRQNGQLDGRGNGRNSRRRINRAAANKLAEAKIAEYNIKGRPDSTVESLSGGNQQRTLLALLPDKLQLLIMEHPTRGLDVESALYIWRKLLERRKDGTAIIYSSADLDEILQYSDRVLICYAGRVTAVVQTADTNVTELGYLIAGKNIRQGLPDV